jgi:hypothetical protein
MSQRPYWRTDAELRTYVRQLGLTYSKREGEYRINFRWGTEATAYYTPPTERMPA